MILDHSFGGIIFVTELFVLDIVIRNLHEGNIGNHISNLKSAESEPGPVVGQLAQESVGGTSQRLHVFWRHFV